MAARTRRLPVRRNASGRARLTEEIAPRVRARLASIAGKAQVERAEIEPDDIALLVVVWQWSVPLNVSSMRLVFCYAVRTETLLLWREDGGIYRDVDLAKPLYVAPLGFPAVVLGNRQAADIKQAFRLLAQPDDPGEGRPAPVPDDSLGTPPPNRGMGANEADAMLRKLYRRILEREYEVGNGAYRSQLMAGREPTANNP